MAYKIVFNPLGGRAGSFDYVDVTEVASASNTANGNLELDEATNRLYVWINGHRRYVATTLDDPTITAGQPIPPFLWISTS